jgi:hypothetical protein
MKLPDTSFVGRATKDGFDSKFKSGRSPTGLPQKWALNKALGGDIARVAVARSGLVRSCEGLGCSALISLRGRTEEAESLFAIGYVFMGQRVVGTVHRTSILNSTSISRLRHVRPRCRWVDNIKLDRGDIGLGGVNWVVWLRIGISAELL